MIYVVGYRPSKVNLTARRAICLLVKELCLGGDDYVLTGEILGAAEQILIILNKNTHLSAKMKQIGGKK